MSRCRKSCLSSWFVKSGLAFFFSSIAKIVNPAHFSVCCFIWWTVIVKARSDNLRSLGTSLNEEMENTATPSYLSWQGLMRSVMFRDFWLIVHEADCCPSQLSENSGGEPSGLLFVKIGDVSPHSCWLCLNSPWVVLHQAMNQYVWNTENLQFQNFIHLDAIFLTHVLY